MTRKSAPRPKRWGATPVVVDVSFVASFILPDETTTESANVFENIEDYIFHVPDVFGYEITNVLLKAVRKGRIPTVAVEDVLAHVEALGFVSHSMPRAGVLFSTAFRYNLTAYDAAYLLLAQSLSAPIFTFDKALARAAGRPVAGG